MNRLAAATAALALVAGVAAWVASLHATRPVAPEPAAPSATGPAPHAGAASPPSLAAKDEAADPAGTPGDGPRAAADPAADAGARVRDVTPPGVTPPPPLSGPLERLPARVVPKPPPGPPKPRLIRPVAVDEPGILKAGSIEVVLPGIRPLDAGRQCHDRQGREWPCGARALAAMRAFVGGRGVHCILPADARAGRFVSACRNGRIDVGEWLVRQGWALAAEADDGPGALAGLEAEARREKRGQWIEILPQEPPVRLPDLPALGLTPSDAAAPPDR